MILKIKKDGELIAVLWEIRRVKLESRFSHIYNWKGYVGAIWPENGVTYTLEEGD